MGDSVLEERETEGPGGFGEKTNRGSPVKFLQMSFTELLSPPRVGGRADGRNSEEVPTWSAGETVNVEMLFFFSSQKTQGGQMSGQGPRIGDKGAV